MQRVLSPLTALSLVVLFSVLVPVNVNAQAPVVYLISPLDGAAYNTTTVEAVWEITTGSEPLNRSEYSLDEGSFIDVGNRTQVLFEDLTEGPHSLTVVCHDEDGMSGEVTVTFLVDTFAPNLEFTSPGTTYTNLDSIYVEWTVNDTVSQVDRIETRLNDGPWEDRNRDRGAVVKLPGEGEHDLRVRAHDEAGNSVEIRKELEMDRTNPDVEIISPLDLALLNTSRVEVIWSGGDQGSGISYFEVKLDANPPEQYDEPGSVFWSGIRDGRHEVRVYAYDMAGNLKMAVHTFQVDTLDPYVVQYFPMDDDVGVSDSIWVTFSELMDEDSIEVEVEGVRGNLSISNSQVIFVPDGLLEYGKVYNLTLNGRDLFGNWVGDFEWSFTTTDIGYVSGTVVDRFGNPIPNVLVNLDGNATDRTDGMGRFNLTYKMGEYNINFTRTGYKIENMTVCVIPGTAVELDGVTLYLQNENSDNTDRKIASLVAGILVLIFLLLLMLTVFIVKKARGPVISHEDRDEMLEILRHFDISTRIDQVDCYGILGVKRNAPDKDIKKAYRKLAGKYHPDKAMHQGEFDDDEAHIKMKEINAAKNILLSPEKRDLQDRILKVTKRY